ncbi:MAG TPA: acyl carrier protein [Flavisolibacter sp.]|jgi:acyl carrier protein
MDATTFYEKIARALSKVLSTEISPAQLNENTDLLNDIGLNSLDFLQFILQLEESFDMEIDIQKLDIQYFRNLGKLNTFLGGAHANNNVA